MYGHGSNFILPEAYQRGHKDRQLLTILTPLVSKNRFLPLILQHLVSLVEQVHHVLVSVLSRLVLTAQISKYHGDLS